MNTKKYIKNQSLNLIFQTKIRLVKASNYYLESTVRESMFENHIYNGLQLSLRVYRPHLSVQPDTHT